MAAVQKAALSRATVKLHWLAAVGVIGMLGVGLDISGMPRGPDKVAMIQMHKSAGMIGRSIAVHFQNTKTLSAAMVSAASSSMVLRCVPAMISASEMPRASRHVPHNRTRPFPAMTRFNMRSRL